MDIPSLIGEGMKKKKNNVKNITKNSTTPFH